VAKVSPWLTSRGSIGDWVTDTQTEAGNRVSLSKQDPGFVSHPLMMNQPLAMGVGLQRPATPRSSRLALEDPSVGGSFSAADYDDINEVGFQRPTPEMESELPLHDITGLSLWDLLATEDLAPICTQDGRELGMA